MVGCFFSIQPNNCCTPHAIVRKTGETRQKLGFVRFGGLFFARFCSHCLVNAVFGLTAFFHLAFKRLSRQRLNQPKMQGLLVIQSLRFDISGVRAGFIGQAPRKVKRIIGARWRSIVFAIAGRTNIVCSVANTKCSVVLPPGTAGTGLVWFANFGILPWELVAERAKNPRRKRCKWFVLKTFQKIPGRLLTFRGR